MINEIRIIARTLSVCETLDNATYPTAGVKYRKLKTKIICCTVCPIILWTIEQQPVDSMECGQKILKKLV